MCGIAGFLDLEGRRDRPERLGILSAMGHQIRRRGPDDEQLYDDDRISLVFRRLSIIDVAGGRQPIWNEDESLCVLVNGEIYNHRDLRAQLREPHRFRTQSDSEIVLHLFEERGPAALELLNGMFAICLWDARNRRLLLARDRFGIKPMYYAVRANQLIFGSEIKALLAHPDCSRRLDWNQLTTFSLPFRLASFVEGVEQLPGGHFLTCDAGGHSLHEYWRLDRHFGSASGRTAASYVDEYADLFADSVKRHLMSDVTVGAFLSGGLDSSMIVAAAAESAKLECFTVVERALVLNGDAPAAREVARHLELPLHGMLVDPRTIADDLDFALDRFEYFVWCMDWPFFHFDWFLKHELHRFARTLLPNLKVILNGQGSDEYSGGYSRHVTKLTADWPGYLERIRGDLGEAMHREVPLWARSFLRKDYFPVRAEQRGFSMPQLEASLITGITLQNYNLWLEDRVAATQGIETRVPFLDHRLVELLVSIPEELQAELLWDKEITRRAAARWLPERFTRRRKVGFAIGMDPRDRREHGLSLDEILRQLIRRIFPAFREKYLAPSDSIFSTEALDELFDRICASARPEARLQDQMFTCMGVAIFARMCEDVVGAAPRRTLDVPSTLRETESLPDELMTVELPEPPAWTESDVVRLARGARIFSEINRGSSRRRLRLFTAHGASLDLVLSEGQEWLGEMLDILSGAPTSVAALAGELGLEIDELAETLRQLHQSGWIARAASTRGEIAHASS